MSTYRIGSVLGRIVAGYTPHALVCETCNEELESTVPVQRGQEKFAGMTVAGVKRIWPDLEKVVRQHEDRSHKSE